MVTKHSSVAMLASKTVVTCGPARLSCSCVQVGASLSPVRLARALLPVPHVRVGRAPSLLEREKFHVLSYLPTFFADRSRNLEACCSGCKGCHRNPHPGLCSACPRVFLPAAPSFSSHLPPTTCSAPHSHRLGSGRWPLLGSAASSRSWVPERSQLSIGVKFNNLGLSNLLIVPRRTHLPFALVSRLLIAGHQ